MEQPRVLGLQSLDRMVEGGHLGLSLDPSSGMGLLRNLGQGEDLRLISLLQQCVLPSP